MKIPNHIQSDIFEIAEEYYLIKKKEAYVKEWMKEEGIDSAKLLDMLDFSTKKQDRAHYLIEIIESHPKDDLQLWKKREEV